MGRILSAVLLASPLLFTVAAVAAEPAAATASPAQVRVSTGITAPRILSTTGIQIPAALREVISNDATYTLKVTINADGKAENARIVNSANHYLNDTVLAAVQSYKWLPATLDDQTIPMDVTLNVVVAK